MSATLVAGLRSRRRWTLSVLQVRTAVDRSGLFEREYKRQPTGIQRAIDRAVNHLSPGDRRFGMHCERVRGAEDRWTCRVNRSIRLLFETTQEGLRLVWVGPHDEAYRRGDGIQLLTADAIGIWPADDEIGGYTVFKSSHGRDETNVAGHLDALYFEWQSLFSDGWPQDAVRSATEVIQETLSASFLKSDIHRHA